MKSFCFLTPLTVFQNNLQNCVNILNYIRIIKTEHPKTKTSQSFISFLIIRHLIQVSAAVKFHNQVC